MSNSPLIALARAAAAAHSLDPALVCAVCEQESTWNPWAIRFEPEFFARYISPQLAPVAPTSSGRGPSECAVPQPRGPGKMAATQKLSVTEAYARAFSWGLMQVMGQVAREHNFNSAGIPACVSLPSLGLATAPTTSTAAQKSSSVIPSPDDLHRAEGSRCCFSSGPLSALCDPATGLDVGCRVLAAKLASAHSDVPRALQLWNGGANPNYAAEVLARVAKYL